MMISQIYKFIAQLFDVAVSEVAIYLQNNEYALPDGKPIMGNWIETIKIKEEKHAVGIFVHECTNFLIQAQYEERLLLCAFNKGQKYNNKPPSLIEVNTKNINNGTIVNSSARLLYYVKDSVYSIQDDGYFIATKTGKFYAGFKEMIQNGQKQWEYNMLSDLSIPKWYDLIGDAGDLYKHPLNEPFWNEVTYLRDSSIYYGLNVVYKPGLLAFIKLEECWIKVDTHWLSIYQDKLPERIQYELQLANNLN